MQDESLANRTEGQTDWQSVNWRHANRRVRNLRQRIFRATRDGDWDKVQSLQRLMLRSYANTLVSVRRVTQVNQGRHTAGVDKLVIKTPEARGRLVDHLSTHQPGNAQPAKRVSIPKANGRQRPLSIPTVLDRCQQARVKNALEPSWEARFEGTSYGFRPGRGCQDAIARIFTVAHGNARRKWVVDADITGAFDNISQDHILTTSGAFPARDLIRQWLKAGYVDGGVFHDTLTGTGQGSVISPLLANAALHGLEEALGVSYDRAGHIKPEARVLIRYADDFVVFCATKEDAEAVIDILTAWLAQRGLHLSGEKTRIVHLTEGFDFLGFNIRLYPARTRTGHKLLIKPSAGSTRKMREKLRDEWAHLQGHPVDAVIARLTPLIRGWATYFRHQVASDVFTDMDGFMLGRELRYARRTHPRKSKTWRTARYWGKLHSKRDDHWVFGNTKTGAYLLKFRWFKIDRHVLVRGTASPDDPLLRAYWAARSAARAKDHTPSTQKLAHAQNNVCQRCGESLFNGEEVHKHHKEPRAQGGQDTYANLELTHLYCHHQIHGGKGETVAIPAHEPTRSWLRKWLA